MLTPSEPLSSGARVLVTTSIVVPDEKAMPLERLEAFVADAFRHGGMTVKWVGAEFITEADDG